MPITWQPIANSLQTILQSSLGSGPRVYSTIRWTNQPDQFQALFQNVNAQTLSAWFITRDRAYDTRGGVANARSISLPYGQDARIHSVMIDGFLSFKGDGSTETTFQAQVDSVLTSLANAVTLNGAVDYCSPPASSIDLENMAAVFCHHVSIQFDAYVRQVANFA